MSFTFSQNFPIGELAPYFELLDVVSGQTISLAQVQGKNATVVMFICNHCPYVIHIKPQMAQIANEFKLEGVSFVAISANDVENFPQDGPEKMKEDAVKHAYSFPYLYDQTQEVAKAYKASCTPDFYVFDKDLKCTYHGRFDDSSPKNNIKSTGKDLQHAIVSTLHNSPIPVEEQKPSSGCNIKWKSGVSPF